MKVIDTLPGGEIRDEYQKLLGVLSADLKRGEDQERMGDEEGEVMPFPVENRLCSIFPEVMLPLSTHLHTRIFFCLPHVKKPDIVPKFEEKIL
jgi:hypothetical protein